MAAAAAASVFEPDRYFSQPPAVAFAPPPPTTLAALQRQHDSSLSRPQRPGETPGRSTSVQRQRGGGGGSGDADGGSFDSSLTAHSGQRSTAPVRAANHRRVVAALTSTLLAGPQASERLRAARRAVDAHEHRMLVIALVSSGPKATGAFSGIYAVIEEGSDGDSGGGLGSAALPTAAAARAATKFATRIFGSGPAVITGDMVHTLLKFDTASKRLLEVGRSGTWTPSVDAVGLDASLFIVPTKHV